MSHRPFWLKFLLLGFGGLSLLLGLALVYGTWSLQQQATHTQGTVLELVERKVSKSEGKIQYAIRYEFTTDAGERIEHTTEWSTPTAQYAVGEPIPVAYAPDDPANHVAGGLFAVWMFPIGTVLFGAVLLIVWGSWLRGNEAVDELITVGGFKHKKNWKAALKFDTNDDSSDKQAA